MRRQKATNSSLTRLHESAQQSVSRHKLNITQHEPTQQSAQCVQHTTLYLDRCRHHPRTLRRHSNHNKRDNICSNDLADRNDRVLERLSHGTWCRKGRQTRLIANHVQAGSFDGEGCRDLVQVDFVPGVMLGVLGGRGEVDTLGFLFDD